MAYCQNCGKKVKKNDDFCPYCGKKTKFVVEKVITKEEVVEKPIIEEHKARKEEIKILCSVCKKKRNISEKELKEVLEKNIGSKKIYYKCQKCKKKESEDEGYGFFFKVFILIIGFFVMMYTIVKLIPEHELLSILWFFVMIVSVYYYIKLVIYWLRTPEQRLNAKLKKEEKKARKEAERRREEEELERISRLKKDAYHRETARLEAKKDFKTREKPWWK